MAAIDRSSNIAGVRLAEQASAPGTPPTGFVQVYAKADGLVYIKDDAGVETNLATGGGGVSDGDKGDIVASSSGAVWTIDSSVLTAAGRALIDDANAAAQRATLGLTQAQRAGRLFMFENYS